MKTILNIVLVTAIGASSGLVAQTGVGGNPVSPLIGVVISEVYSEGYQPTSSLGAYIELWNRDVLNPVAIGGSRLQFTTATGLTRNFVFPSSAQLAPGGTAILAASPISGGGTPNVEQFVDAQFFTGSILAPNARFSICFFQVDGAGATIRVDGVPFNSVLSCTQATWQGPPVPFTDGYAQRVLRVDSDTLADWYEVTQPPQQPVPPVTQASRPSPGRQNPELAPINGFLLGENGQDGIVLPTPTLGPTGATGTNVNIISGTRPAPITTSVTVATGEVRAVLIPTHPDPQFREIRDPRFDPVLSQGRLVANGTISGNDALLAQAIGGPLGWEIIVPPRTPGANPGVLKIDMGSLQQVQRTFEIGAATPTGRRFRVERVLSDLLTDDTASGSGETSEVQAEVLPDPMGPGDVWCELIVYDPSGFKYVAKVKNWPSNPLNCATPNFGMSSPSAGRLDLIALCFNAAAELYILPSLTTTGAVGSGPFLGIALDAFTLAFLAAPLGADPAHVVTSEDGLYYFSTTALPPGTTVDALAAEYLPGVGFVTVSPVRRVTVM